MYLFWDNSMQNMLILINMTRISLPGVSWSWGGNWILLHPIISYLLWSLLLWVLVVIIITQGSNNDYYNDQYEDCKM